LLPEAITLATRGCERDGEMSKEVTSIWMRRGPKVWTKDVAVGTEQSDLRERGGSRFAAHRPG